MSDLMASFEIFAGNFNAQYGRLINLLLPLLVLGVLIAMTVRTAMTAARAQRQADLPDPVPDEADKTRLGEALAEAVRCPTVSGNADALAALCSRLEARYPLVFSKLQRLEPRQPWILLRWKGSDPEPGSGRRQRQRNWDWRRNTRMPGSAPTIPWEKWSGSGSRTFTAPS